MVSSDSTLANDLLHYLSAVVPPSAFKIVTDTLHQTTHAIGQDAEGQRPRQPAADPNHHSGSKIALGVLTALW